MAGRVPARLSRAEGRRFGLTLGLAFLALGGLLLWRGRESLAIVAGVLGVLLVAAGSVAPGSLGPVYHGWMRFALLLSKVTTPVFLGIIYFLVLTPLGVLRRLLGRDPVARAPSDSLWVALPEDRHSDLERQF